MKILISLLGSILIVFLTNLSLNLLQEKYELKLDKARGFIIDRLVLLLYFLSALSVFILSFYKIRRLSTVEFILFFILLFALGILSITDIKKKVVPNGFLLLIFFIWLMILSIFIVLDIEHSFHLIVDTLVGGMIAACLFGISYFAARGQLGAGDVKLAIIMGIYLMKDRALIAFLFGTIILSMYSLVMLALKKIKLKDSVPMVPFLSIGALITILLS